MIERIIKVPVDPSPNELAFCFCNMSSDGQAMFFNEIANLTENRDASFCFQLQSIADEGVLTNAGRNVMEQIGEYGPKSNK